MTRFSTAIILLAIGLLAIGCAPKSKQTSFKNFAWGKTKSAKLTADQHIRLSDGFMAQNRTEMAYIHLNKALEIRPDDPSIMTRKADLLEQKGLNDQALAEYQAVLKKHPQHAPALEGAGLIYLRAGLDQDAKAMLGKAIAANDKMWRSHNGLGIILDRSGDHNGAARHFRKALALKNGRGSAGILNNLGVVYMATHEYSNAVAVFRKALSVGGASTRTYNNLGLALARLGLLDQALEAFRFGGDESKAYNNLGYVLLMDGKPEKAIPYFEKAIELAPTYYTKAFENLKRARLALKFKKNSHFRGSTPNRSPTATFPADVRNPVGATAPSGVVTPTPSTGVKHIAAEGSTSFAFSPAARSSVSHTPVSSSYTPSVFRNDSAYSTVRISTRGITLRPGGNDI